MHDLQELWQRLELCECRSASLRTEINAARGTSVQTWMQPSQQQGTGHIYGKLLTPPSIEFRTSLGMIVNEQRAILDALAVQLARRNRINDVSKTYFPISKNPEAFKKDGRSKIAALSEVDQARIAAIEPWPEGNDDLWRLHEADRYRKHQGLLVWACIGGVSYRGRVGVMNTGPAVFREVGKTVTMAFFAGSDATITTHIDLVYTEPPAVDGHSASDCLDQANAAVRNILNLFS